MKNKAFLILLFIGLLAKGQYQVEWIKDFGSQVSSFSRSGEHLLVASSENSMATIYFINPSGSVDFKDTSGKYAIKYLTRDPNFLHEISIHYKRRSANGQILESHLLGTTPLVSPRKLKSSIYGTFSKSVMKYDLKGKELLRFDIWTSGDTQKMEIADDHLYLFTVIYDAPGGIFKYDTLGNRIWLFCPPFITTNFFTDPIGNCFVLGSTMDGHDHIIKLDKNGSKIWQLTVDSFGIMNGCVRGDSIFVCGTAPGQKSAIMIISSSGKELVRQSFTMTADNWGEKLIYIIPTDQNLYVGGGGGYKNGKGYIAKLIDSRFVSLKESINSLSSIEVFPNPAGDEINIQLKARVSNSVYVSLIDQLGRVIVKQKFHIDEFNSEQIKLKAPAAKGVYFVKVEDGKNTFTEKVIFN